MKFHKDYYSSNLMKGVIYSDESLETLEKWVIESFSGVPNYKRMNPAKKCSRSPWTSDDMNRIVYLTPVKDEDHLAITFYLPVMTEHYKQNPCAYVDYLLHLRMNSFSMTKKWQR